VPSSSTTTERTIARRVFSHWSIEIPVSFAETFVTPESYWHAWDEHRSISMTSIQVADANGPVNAKQITRELLPIQGESVDELPPGLDGWAAIANAIQPAKASRILSGILTSEGRVLIVTITTDDLGWARQSWLSIRHHPAPAPRSSPWRGVARRRR
jgi:hypothetical protein